MRVYGAIEQGRQAHLNPVNSLPTRYSKSRRRLISWASSSTTVFVAGSRVDSHSFTRNSWSASRYLISSLSGDESCILQWLVQQVVRVKIGCEIFQCQKVYGGGISKSPISWMVFFK